MSRDSVNQTTAEEPRWSGKTLEQWAQILDCSPERAKKAIDNLIAKGLIVEVANGR